MRNNNSLKFINNGFLVIQYTGFPKYTGVCGSHWPIDEEFEKDLNIPEYFENAVAVATDWDKAYTYWRLCVERGTDVSLLLVSTYLDFPKVDIQDLNKWQELGYDVSSVSGSFYSAIQQEIIRQDIFLFSEWKSRLNDFGLFQTPEAAKEFMAIREQTETGQIESCVKLELVKVSRFCEN
jgi:hypothetical protein